MSITRGDIPNLFNGISQQAPSLRLPSQAAASDNFYSTIAMGLRPRPGTSHLAKLRAGGASDADAFVHTINRSATERYAVVILNGSIEVFNLVSGVACTVSTPDGVGYLVNSLPRTGFAAVTVADTTFIVNKGVATAMAATTSTGSLLGTKQRFSDLPTSPASGDIWRIQGDPSNEFTVYWVQWNGSVWVECCPPGTTTTLDAATLPVKLVRTALNTFTLQRNTWDLRLVGDNATNPVPSFVGQTLQDVFFYRNRLGFLSDENVILSRAGKYFNFWAETMTAVLDTDPIDVTVDAAASPDRINILRFAVPFNKVLLIFSDQTQFQLSSGPGAPALTPETARVDVVTAFESGAKARPVLAGTSVFFPTERNAYSGMREYYVAQDEVSNDASDVAAHVPSYVPANIFRLAASTGEDVLLCLTENERSAVYVYKYYWGEDNKKLQSAWMRFSLSSDNVILGVSFIGSTLYVVTKRADGVFVESLDFHPAATEALLPFAAGMDRKVALTGVFNAATNTTTWTLPYEIASGTPAVIRGSGFGNLVGSLVLSPTLATPTTVTALGDHSAAPCVVGLTYTARYRFSQFFVKDQGNRSIITGSLQLQRLTVAYDMAAYFRVEVTFPGGTTSTYPFTGEVFGVSQVGVFSRSSGAFKVPCVGPAEGAVIELVTDSPLPCSFQSAAWEGDFVTFSG